MPCWFPASNVTGICPWCRCWIRHLITCSDKQLIWNHLTFRNRIGLSAGFDKGAEIFDELADYGFGFIEVGTVTPDSQDGNPVRVFFACLSVNL